jgi:hypothetical protein
MMNPHNYRRPGWLCVECNEEWPCAARRVFWLEKYTTGVERMKLRGILGAIQLDAEKDLGKSFYDLSKRFTEWTFTHAELDANTWPEKRQGIIDSRQADRLNG